MKTYNVEVGRTTQEYLTVTVEVEDGEDIYNKARDEAIARSLDPVWEHGGIYYEVDCEYYEVDCEEVTT